MIGARNRDLAVLQRLAQRIQHPRIELRQLVKKQHALMRQRDLAGLARMPPPVSAAMLAE
jgi:hypothetical protein